MVETNKSRAKDALKLFRVPGQPLYLIGTFDSGVTVYSQQLRACNLVWSLFEAEKVIRRPPVADGAADARNASKKAKRVAIVGGGFAGLTTAAALLKKEADVHLTIFEQRDTLLPLQQGSDSRWLHPRIYDWPAEGSEASVAMLPVLNWTAARASDVAVQILTEWGRIAGAVPDAKETLSLYCNARHLQISPVRDGHDRLKIEWVGERRDPEGATMPSDTIASATGSSMDFDAVVLAVGFGLERDGATSYWRNDPIGQPSLNQPRSTYIISGQGDGAMIDLLRLRISQYRQDRILDELFGERPKLLEAIRRCHRDSLEEGQADKLFDAFESLAKDACGTEFDELLHDLSHRLRRDTDAVLKLNVRKFSELFHPDTTRISFQNRLLVYLLYRCGGFFPSNLEEHALMDLHSIPASRVVHRHGTLRDEQLKALLSSELYDSIEKRRGKAKPDPFAQSERPLWNGGYFGYPGREADVRDVKREVRQHWRREYLPGPTSLLATAFCSGVASVLLSKRGPDGTATPKIRLTLHRATHYGGEELLQQVCDYCGGADIESDRTAARTFPIHNATIGLAYRCRRIVRSLQAASIDDIRTVMAALDVEQASRIMKLHVSFVLAIPLLEPDTSFTAPSPVSGVIYVDSEAPGYFVDDEQLRIVTGMAQALLYELENPAREFDRLRNVSLSQLATAPAAGEPLPKECERALEFVQGIDPPRTTRAFQFNFDHTDFASVRTRK